MTGGNRVRFNGGPKDGEVEELPVVSRFYEMAVDGPIRLVDGWATNIYVFRYALRRVIGEAHGYEAVPA